MRSGLIAGLLVFGLVAVVAVDRGPGRITDNASRIVTVATLPCATGLQATSSGFVFGDRTVVTVAHAIHHSRDLAVRDAMGRWHDAVIWHLDLERDLAALRVEGLRAGPMPTEVAGAGTAIALLGGAASGEVDGTVIRAVSINTAHVGDPTRSSVRHGYELDLGIAGGDSGAAVVDGAGRLIGIVFARSTARSGVSWATAVDEIQHVVDRREVPSWDCGPDPGTTLVRTAMSDAEPLPLAG